MAKSEPQGPKEVQKKQDLQETCIANSECEDESKLCDGANVEDRQKVPSPPLNHSTLPLFKRGGIEPRRFSGGGEGVYKESTHT